MAKTVSSTFIEQVYNSRKTLMSYLKNENYECDDYDEFSINDVSSMFSNNQLDLLLTNSTNNKIYVKYHLEKTLRPNVLYDIIEDLYNTEAILTKEDTLVLIIKDEPNESLVKILKTIWDQEGIFIVVFSIKHLLINILEHTYVPKHIKLSNSEQLALNEKFNIENNSQMPEISRFDPVSRAIFMRPGQVCKIIRYSDSSLIKIMLFIKLKNYNILMINKLKSKKDKLISRKKKTLQEYKNNYINYARLDGGDAQQEKLDISLGALNGINNESVNLKNEILELCLNKQEEIAYIFDEYNSLEQQNTKLQKQLNSLKQDKNTSVGSIQESKFFYSEDFVNLIGKIICLGIIISFLRR